MAMEEILTSRRDCHENLASIRLYQTYAKHQPVNVLATHLARASFYIKVCAAHPNTLLWTIEGGEEKHFNTQYERTCEARQVKRLCDK